MRRLLVPLLLLLAGCGSGNVASTPAGMSGPPDPPTNSVRIGLLEYDIATSSNRVKAGTIELTVTNAGTVPHDLRIEGMNERTPILPPGRTAFVTLETNGLSRLVLWCSVSGHRAQGMERSLDIVG